MNRTLALLISVSMLLVTMLMATATGYLLQWTGSYVPIFFLAASAYLFVLLLIHLLAPRLEPAEL